MKFLLLIISTALSLSVYTQKYAVEIGLLKYGGGGDWYANLETSLPNLAHFCNSQLNTSINPQQRIIEVGSADIFNVPFVHMTGHGNVVFTQEESSNLRKYLIAGGFLHIDDNYGMDQFIRIEMKKVFPELDFVELPANHPIYHQSFDFNKGLPKIHEHDNKPAGGFGLILDGRLICFYSAESDLGDGWEDAEVHKDSEETRLKALKMGANIVQFAMMNVQ